MAPGIETLPADLVDLIAAGEVIDSLAAVVRELAENALDAGATRIGIALDLQRWRVRLADNGSGMALEDLERAATAHSTSKIRARQDLWQISSLGFRGEALHSLAQLAQLEIASCPATSQEGWQARYDSQGQPLQLEPIALAPGTVVTADQIFANWASRRQGLPSPAQQLRAIQTTIYHLALCHPQVTWQVQQQEREWFNLYAGKTVRQILPQILRDVRLADLQEWRQPELELALGLPDRCHRRRPDWVKIAVNGRVVQLPELEQTIFTSFRRALPRDRFPVCFVHLQVPPAQIDWNRHPAKAEVYLHHLDTWRERLSAAIDQALRLSPLDLSDSLDSVRVGTLFKAAETVGGYLPQRQINSDGASNLPSPGSASLKALAQVHKRYILAEHPAGVWLIEQHIAHERVLYEQLCDRWQLVPLEPGILLPRLNPAQVEQLQRLDLAIEPFGEEVWMVRTAPALLAQRPDCAEALLELSLGGDLQTAQVAVACRSAIRNGTTLTLSEMQTLLEQWQQTRNPRTCPHGRPICLTLEESSLARYFRRHWVIGKSHGI